ncbi:aminopeptidase, partial [Vibrio parahaemolyticus]|nr:aminopeptidase [Vibrio parahaemolyticus]
GTEPDYAAMSYSGGSNGELSGELVFVTPDFNFDSDTYDSSDGCEASDFEGKAIAGKIAVIQRGSCSFSDKVVNAQNAGAIAAIIFNQGNDEGRKGVVNGTLGSDTSATIPAFGVRFELGESWYQAAQSASVPAVLNIDVKDEMVVTQNVI